MSMYLSLDIYFTITLVKKYQLLQWNRERKIEKRKPFTNNTAIWNNNLIWKRRHVFEHLFETTTSFVNDKLIEYLFLYTSTKDLKISYVYLGGSMAHLNKNFRETIEKEIVDQLKNIFYTGWWIFSSSIIKLCYQ